MFNASALKMTAFADIVARRFVCALVCNSAFGDSTSGRENSLFSRLNSSFVSRSHQTQIVASVGAEAS